MELMHRFGSNISDEYLDKYINAIKKYPDSCDNVWFATHYGYPKIDSHRSLAEFLVPYAEKLRQMGISVSLQLSNTIGHGEYMASKDCSGLVFDGSPAKKLVGHDGAVADYCFCWRGNYFRKYLIEEVECYASLIKPDCIWVDDDFRAVNHSPVSFGCFCDDCISEFNRRYDCRFTRKALVNEILYGKTEWRERYVGFVREGLHDLMLDISTAVHNSSPDTAMCLQNGPNGSYTGFGLDFILDAMREGTGHDPKYRPGGGAYDDHNPNNFIEKVIALNWQNASLPDYVRHKCPEIENLPFVVYGKSPYGTAFETSFYFANGNTDMTYSMAMTLNEDMSHYEKELELFSIHRPYWEKMSDINAKTYQAGMQFFISKDAYKKRAKTGDGLDALFFEHYNALIHWTRDAFPIAYDKKDDTVFVLHPNCVDALTDDDVKYLLTKNVFTDGETVKLLSDRGYDLGISAYLQDNAVFTRITEHATDSPINAGLKTWKASLFTPGDNSSYYIVPNNAEIKVLAFYESLVSLEAYTDSKDYPYGISDLILTTPLGAQWAVFGHCPWKGVISSAKQQQILNAVDYICGGRLCARVETPFPAVLLPRKNERGETACVALTNCTIGDSGKLKVRIRNSAGSNFSYMSQYDGYGSLDYVKDGNDYIVTVPNIKPWSVLTIFIE